MEIMCASVFLIYLFFNVHIWRDTGSFPLESADKCSLWWTIKLKRLFQQPGCPLYLVVLFCCSNSALKLLICELSRTDLIISFKCSKSGFLRTPLNATPWKVESANHSACARSRGEPYTKRRPGGHSGVSPLCTRRKWAFTGELRHHTGCLYAPVNRTARYSVQFAQGKAFRRHVTS